MCKSGLQNNKVLVNVDHNLTEGDFFTAEDEIDQGNAMSPNVFKFFVNGLPTILQEKSDSVCLNNNNIPYLLYADDSHYIFLLQKLSQVEFQTFIKLS